MSGRIRSKAGAEAIAPQVTALAEEISASASAMVQWDGKLGKLSKTKKVLTPGQQLDKQPIAMFEKSAGCTCLALFHSRAA